MRSASADAEPGIGARFGLAWERLAPEDERTREWLDRAARVPDPDERCDTRIDVEPRRCPVCREMFISDGRQTVCTGCRSRGFISTPCRKCGGPLRKLDAQNSKRNPDRIRVCAKCRAEMPPDMTPQQSLELARAAKKKRPYRIGPGRIAHSVERAKRKLVARGYRIEEVA